MVIYHFKSRYPSTVVEWPQGKDKKAREVRFEGGNLLTEDKRLAEYLKTCESNDLWLEKEYAEGEKLPVFQPRKTQVVSGARAAS